MANVGEGDTKPPVFENRLNFDWLAGHQRQQSEAPSRGIPGFWWLGLHLLVQGVWIQPLLEDLRSCMPHGPKTKM